MGPTTRISRTGILVRVQGPVRVPNQIFSFEVFVSEYAERTLCPSSQTGLLVRQPGPIFRAERVLYAEYLDRSFDPRVPGLVIRYEY